MWKYLEKPKTVLASRSLVDEFNAMDPAPHDRPLSEKRMMVYERILRAGEFRPVTWASAHCAETGCTYRVNGKHTATLLSKLNPIPEFHVTVERYAVDTLNEVASLYNTFDSSLASRTARDINMAFAATVPAIRDKPILLIGMAVSAIAAQKWNDNELKRIPPAERAEELLDNTDFVLWLHEMFPNTGGGRHSPTGLAASVKPLRRVPVASAMLATYRKSPQSAKKFWLMVRDETAPDRDDPSRVLTRFLVRAAIAGGFGASKDKKSVSGREMYAKCVHAWNAWRKGERTALNYHSKSPVPVPVK